MAALVLSLAIIAGATLTNRELGGAAAASALANSSAHTDTAAAAGNGALNSTQRATESRLAADAIANVLLFIPFGVAAGLLVAGRTTRRVTLTVVLIGAAGAAISLAIELAQLTGIVAGRVASPLDVATNTTGALAGALIAVHACTLLFPRRDTVVRLTAAWCTAAAILLALAQYATSRAVTAAAEAPTPSPLPFTTGYGWFEGLVPSATVNGTHFTQRGTGAIRISAPVTAAETLSATVVSSDRRRGMVPVLFVHAPGQDIAHTIIGQRGPVLALRVATRVDRFGLRYPDLVVTNPTPWADTTGSATPPTTRHITASVTGRHWELAATTDSPASATSGSTNTTVPNVAATASAAGSSPTSTTHARFYAGFWTAWMLVAPISRVNSPLAALGSILFLLSFALPPVYWMARRRNTHVPH